jgi:hypothetical protein
MSGESVILYTDVLLFTTRQTQDDSCFDAAKEEESKDLRVS